MGWGNFFDGLMDKLPIQGRVERWKNELDQREEERETLEWRKCNAKISKRLAYLNNRIDKLNRLLKNKAK